MVVVYPQRVQNLWISYVEGVNRVKSALNSRCQITKNRGKKLVIHRLWVLNVQVRQRYVDTVHKYSTAHPQLVHTLHKEIHKLSTIKDFSSVDRRHPSEYRQRVLARSGRYWHYEKSACTGRATGSRVGIMLPGQGRALFR